MLSKLTSSEFQYLGSEYAGTLVQNECTFRNRYINKGYPVANILNFSAHKYQSAQN